MRRILLIISLFWKAQASSESVCPAVPLSPDYREFLASVIRSPEYIDQARKSLLDQELFNILVSRYVYGFEGVTKPPSDEEIVQILHGTFTRSEKSEVDAEAESGDHFVPRESFAIPATDVICTDLADSLKTLVDDYWEHVPEGSLGEIEEVLNVGLFTILSASEQMSTGTETACVLWRFLLRQIHYREILSVADTEAIDIGLLDVLSQMALFAKNQSPHLHGNQKQSVAPILILAAPIIAQGAASVACWCIGQCIERYRATTTTTTVEPPRPAEDPMINIRADQRLTFFTTASDNIDAISSAVRTFHYSTPEEFEQGISRLRTFVLEKLSAVASVVGHISAVSTGSFDPSNFLHNIFVLVSHLGGVSSIADFQRIQSEVTSSLSQIRNDLFNLALTTH